MNDKEDVLTSIIAIILIVLLLVGVFFVSQFIAGQTCSQKYSSFENKYSFFTHCQIKIKGKWIPADSYRVL